MKDTEIDGYTCQIFRGLWERILTFGAPRVWAACWTVLCGFAFMSLLFRGHS